MINKLIERGGEMYFMEANEFIKKYGWGKAKEILDSIKIEVSFDGRVCDPCFITEDGDYVSCNELEHFVKSYKLVETCGGLDVAKKHVDRTVFKLSYQIIELKQAIADVESCL